MDYKYVIEQLDFIDNVWFEVGSSTDKLVALENIRQIKDKYPSLIFRLLLVVEIC